jgi:hypothetical protein
MVSPTRRPTPTTPASSARSFTRLAAIAALVAVGSLALPAGTAAAAPADPQPSGGATCTDNADCTVHAGRPGSRPGPRHSPGNTDPGTGPVEPPLQGCIDATICTLPDQPGQQGQPADPVRTAQEQFAKLPITGPRIGTAPQQGGSGLVGLPVWLWTDVTATTWGPYTASATVPGLTVTAVATATRITWNMGDGRQVVCRNPGTRYTARYGNTASPTCGYRYAHSSRSQRNGAYTITGTTAWVIHWAGGGQAGVINQTRQTQTTVRIDELQVVTQ